MKTLNTIAFLSLSSISSLSFAIELGSVVEVSEPSTLALFAISAAALLVFKRKKK